MGILSYFGDIYPPLVIIQCFILKNLHLSFYLVASVAFLLQILMLECPLEIPHKLLF